ncbi:MAG: YqeG family HAD IIIA-type phosphatase, partial [Clostridium sp.]|nr:YqeG family HAD IIIA-type phosphatase [Clostridium sp.]
MLRAFYPNELAASVYEIDFNSWYKRAYRGIIFDIDNTLVPHGAPADERIIRFFQQLHNQGFRTILISNNKEPRVKPFAVAVDSDYIHMAKKPSPSAYLEAMEKIGTNPRTTLFVGDQLFTDVYGAKRVGIYTIRVNPIHPKEEIQIVLKRQLERIVLFFYRKERRK